MPGGERVLDFSRSPAQLSMRHDQLLIRREDEPEVSVPLSEIGVLIIAHRGVTVSHGVLEALMRHGGSVLVCDRSFLPSGLMLPLAANFEQTKRMLAQAGASRPLRKRLWQQIVRAKIRAQAATLRLHRGDDHGLSALAAAVRSGDPANVEGRAAQRYWRALFDDPDFRRRFDAPDQNALLNYGYAVVRAACGRALCAAGLHPSLGIHHRDRGNPWCLADDIMEPYRALVDDEVVEIVGESGSDAPLDSRTKARIIGVLHARLMHAGESRTVFEWIGRTASSLACVYVREAERVFYPEGLWREAPGG